MRLASQSCGHELRAITHVRAHTRSLSNREHPQNPYSGCPKSCITFERFVKPPSTPNLNIELFGKLGACFPECPKSCTTSPAVNIEIRGSRGCHDGVALVVGQLGWCRISGIHRLRLSVPNHFWDFGSSRFELSVRACCYCTCARASVSRRRCDWACADVCVYIYTHIRTALIDTHTHYASDTTFSAA